MCVDCIVSLLGSNTVIGFCAIFLFLIGMLMCAYFECVVEDSKKFAVAAVSATVGFGSDGGAGAILLDMLLL